MLTLMSVDYRLEVYHQWVKSDLIVDCQICRTGSNLKLFLFILEIMRRKCGLLRPNRLCIGIACVRASSLRTLSSVGFREQIRFVLG